ncbi:MAG: inorganic phosphate transporter [Legionella sp.]|nr:inorganic phosphate transporter [Legionella sp.]
MEASNFLIIFIILLALLFDFSNGFHDAGNAIATIVATGVLTPLQAVLWAAFFNFIAFLLLKLAVAKTIGVGLIHPDFISPYLIGSALTSALVWNVMTWYYGLPSSSSHALIGGLAGAAFVTGGMGALELLNFMKVIAAIFITPFVGLTIGLGLTILMKKATASKGEKEKLRWFKPLQLLSSALLCITHGGNDAQKTMGIIAVLLYSNSQLGNHFYIPLWIVITCHFMIALGTLFGGWRIVYTMGEKITKLNPLRGCCAEVGASLVIFAATDFGVPVSTTHIVTGAIAGVGISESFWGTNWGMMRAIFLTWILTVPVTAAIAAIIMTNLL